MARKYTLGLVGAVLVVSASLASADFVNGTFDTDTAWTKVGTVTISGRAKLGGGGDNRGAVYQTVVTTPGDWYKLTYDKLHAGSINMSSGLMVTAFDGAGNANADAYWGQSYWAPDKTGLTAWFQAQGTSTTIQFRDFSYSGGGASNDVHVDNASIVAGTVGVRDEVNVAGSAALSQSSYLNAGTYPAAYGTDGVVNNFMHTSTATGGTYTMTFAADQSVTRIAISAREGFLNRTGNNLYLYDAGDTLVDTLTITDGYYNNLTNTTTGYWHGVRKIVVEETTPSTALNFAEIEVLTAQRVNVAPVGTASAGSVHSSYGADPARAIDGSTDYASSDTVFHSGNANKWWMVELDEGYTLKTVEIQARTGGNYNSRIGTSLEFLDADGDTIFSEAIDSNDATAGGLWTVSGTWAGVFGVRITETDPETLNLAEVRLFADTSVAPIPEPATMSLLAMGGIAMLRRRRK